jgi:hypothetical protein
MQVYAYRVGPTVYLCIPSLGVVTTTSSWRIPDWAACIEPLLPPAEGSILIAEFDSTAAEMELN